MTDEGSNSDETGVGSSVFACGLQLRGARKLRVADLVGSVPGPGADGEWTAEEEGD